MSTILDDCINGLINARYDVPQWQLKGYLKKIYSIAPKHGISSAIMPKFIKFLLETNIISTGTIVGIIEKYLVPNGPLTNDVTNEIMNHLGTITSFTHTNGKTAPKYIQVALCKWLVHVNILLPNSKVEIQLSTWLHLWQYDFLQQWITYIIIFNTQSPNDIKPWKLTILAKISKNPGYRNGKVNATLILRRYLTIMDRSERISNLIQEINCEKSSQEITQNLTLDKTFTNNLKLVLVRESSFRFSNSIFEDEIEELLSQLLDSDIDPAKLNYLSRSPADKSALAQIETLSQLYKNWTELNLPIMVEEFFVEDKHTISQLYPLSLEDLNLTNGNKRIQEFWIQMYSYITIHLKRCFQERRISSKDRFVLFNKIMQCCQVYNDFIPRVIKDFLTLDHLLANKELFLTICTRLFPIMAAPLNFGEFRNTILKVLAVCHLSKEGSGSGSDESSLNGSTFGLVCYSIIQMVDNWFQSFGNDEASIDTSLEILNDVRKLLLSHIHHSEDNRHILMSMILLIETISSVAVRFQNTRFDPVFEDKFLDKIILKNNVIDKLITLDDPLVLNACCGYLIDIKGVLSNRPPNDVYVQLQNQYIMDITNFLWRNKISNSKRIFNIPSEFLKALSDNLTGQQGSLLKFKNVYSITGIPATSYLSVYSMRRIEYKNGSKVKFLKLISDDNFKRFMKEISKNQVIGNVWLPNIKSFDDVKLQIINEINKMNQYRFIVQFLFTYLKSLSKYELDMILDE